MNKLLRIVMYSITMLGLTSGGVGTLFAQEGETASIGRQFVATSVVTVVVLAVVVLVVAFRMGSYFLARRSNGGRSGRGEYGFLGGAVCPNCGRSFGVHWWSFRLGLGRYDRCPHCRKWNMVQRASPEALAAVEQSQPANGNEKNTSDEAAREEESLRQRIEDSRFDEG